MGYLFALLLTIVLAVGGYGAYVTSDLPPIETLLAQQEQQSQNTSSKILAGDGHTVILSNGRFRQTEAEFADIAPSMVNALLATEDRRFYNHHGVDPIGIVRALFSNFKNKGVSEGASTITQQLVRNYFLTNERSFKRKFREIVLAYQLENVLNKQQILEKYLNTIYFGEGAYGIEAAAQVYFSKSARALSVKESALLAGMPQAPSRYNPFERPDLAKARRDEVLTNMVEAGQLSNDEAKQLQSEDLGLHPIPNRTNLSDKVPYFNRYVQQRLMDWFGLSEQEFWQSGFQVFTTLDLNAQRLAEQAVQKVSQQYGRTGRQQQASIVSLKSNTGAILAYVGGRNFADTQYDRVTLAKRSPGSLFKMITYAAAFEKGYLPTDTQVDDAIAYGNWSPSNYDKTHHGMMSLAQAFVTSNNIIAVKLLAEIGPEFVIQLAKNMGLTSELKPGLSLTLGGSSVTLLEMTGAAQSIANQGVWIKPYAIERIVDRRGELVYKHEPQMRDALSPATAHTMVRMMQEVVLRGTGKRANYGQPAAGKTGTSDEYRDAWFVGFTPFVVTGVWIGNDNNQPMGGKESGGTMPSEMWRAYMQPYSVFFPLGDFNVSNARTIEGGPAWGIPGVGGAAGETGTQADAGVIPLDDVQVGEAGTGAQEEAPPLPEVGTGAIPPPTVREELAPVNAGVNEGDTSSNGRYNNKSDRYTEPPLPAPLLPPAPSGRRFGGGRLPVNSSVTPPPSNTEEEGAGAPTP